MKIYFAGNAGFLIRVREQKKRDFKFRGNRLFSYIYVLPGENAHREFKEICQRAREGKE